jgi:DNA-binding NarL/FixJ family response regulator
MNDLTNPTEPHNGSLKSPVIVIIERCRLTRTCIFSILRRELPGYEIFEIATIGELGRASGSDVRLIALDIGDKPLADPLVEDDIAALARSFPHVPVALLSNRDDEASAAMRRGVRGFFPTSIPIEVAVAGLRLVLAGGVYRPLTIDARPNEIPVFETTNGSLGSHAPPGAHDVSPAETGATQNTVVELTPRERHVFAALELGLPNKLIASRLNLSENTVKMHIQHIMRKCSARNRTEAVLFCSGRLLHANGHARSRMSSSS